MSYFDAVNILDEDGNIVGVQTPFSVDGDSIYIKDIKTSLDNIGTFTGTISSLFNNLDDSITDTSATNPKYIEFFLERPAKLGAVALVASTGTFSNVKIILKDRQDSVLATIDESANNQSYKSHEYQVSGISNACCIRIEFHTANAVTLSFAYIRKTIAQSIESIQSVISFNNSTSTVLANGALFTGVAEDVSNAAVIQCAVFADQASATDGLSFQFSTDGTNWDHTDVYTIAANTGKTYSIQPVAKFFRIVYTNGAVTQTAFRMQTIFKQVYIKPSSHRVGDAISAEDDAELIKAVLAAENPSGIFAPINATAGGNLKISMEELESGISSNTNTQLNITPFHADGTEGALITGLDYVSGKSGIDSVSEALEVITYEHHEVHSGSHYFVQNYLDSAINHVLQFTFLMPNTTTWTHFTWSIATEAETLWQIYEGGTITNPLANTITPVNNNRNSANTSGTVLKYEDHANLAAADTDVDVSGALLLAAGISGAGRTGGEARRDSELIMKQNTLYVFRATATAAGFINFDMDWYEHANKN